MFGVRLRVYDLIWRVYCCTAVKKMMIVVGRSFFSSPRLLSWVAVVCCWSSLDNQPQGSCDSCCVTTAAEHIAVWCVAETQHGGASCTFSLRSLLLLLQSTLDPPILSRERRTQNILLSLWKTKKCSVRVHPLVQKGAVWSTIEIILLCTDVYSSLASTPEYFVHMIHGFYEYEDVNK